MVTTSGSPTGPGEAVQQELSGRVLLLGKVKQSLADAHSVALDAREQGALGVVAPPPYARGLSSLATDDFFVGALAGYPTGRHHPLIIASEARLALEFGAPEVWVSVDLFHFADSDVSAQENSLLSTLVTVREAVPEPARVYVNAVGLDGHNEGRLEMLEKMAQQAGLNGVAVEAQARQPETAPAGRPPRHRLAVVDR